MKTSHLQFWPGKTLDYRSAQSLVALACRFEAQSMVEIGNKLINVKSMMGVVLLAKDPIEDMTIIVTGADEAATCDSLTEFIMGI